LITAGADEKLSWKNSREKTLWGFIPLLLPQLVRPRVKCHMTVYACFCMCASLREKKIISFQAFSLRTQEIFFTFLLFKFNCGVLMTNIEEI